MGAAGPGDWDPKDLDDLNAAKRYLERPSLAELLTALLGKPIDGLLSNVPQEVRARLGEFVQSALMHALEMALTTLGGSASRSHEWVHKLAVTLTGMGGGSYGLPSAVAELPVSTGLMLRSIADIARSEGHDLCSLSVRLECVKVFGLGGPRESDDAADTGYWASRIVLDRLATEAAGKYGAKAAGSFAQFLSKILPRFLPVVEEQVAAKFIPVVGALTGGLVNLLFIAHFQDVARGHFIVLRLQNKYGEEATKTAYQAADGRV